MEKEISIYLAGSIAKGHEKTEDSYWTEADRSILRDCLAPYQLHFLNPADRMDDLSDQRSVFGRDMLQVFSCDIVFVDARERRGLGVGAEMMWAKINGIPVITLSPRNSHYMKSETSCLGVSVKEWVHPFVFSLSDSIVSSLQEGALWIKRYVTNPIYEIKGLDSIESSMRYYIHQHLNSDIPMQEILANSSILREKIEQLTS